jgi:hypothetical protein
MKPRTIGSRGFTRRCLAMDQALPPESSAKILLETQCLGGSPATLDIRRWGDALFGKLLAARKGCCFTTSTSCQSTQDLRRHLTGAHIPHF